MKQGKHISGMLMLASWNSAWAEKFFSYIFISTCDEVQHFLPQGETLESVLLYEKLPLKNYLILSPGFKRKKS